MKRKIGKSFVTFFSAVLTMTPHLGGTDRLGVSRQKYVTYDGPSPGQCRELSESKNHAAQYRVLMPLITFGKGVPHPIRPGCFENFKDQRMLQKSCVSSDAMN